MIEYKIYINKQGLKMIDVKYNKKEVIEILDSFIDNGITDFIVVQRDTVQECDTVFISTMKGYFREKQELQEKQYKKVR